MALLKNSSVSENHIQRLFFKWLSLYPHIRQVTFAIPNGGTRHKIEAKNMKERGVTPGVPDIFVGVPSLIYNGLFIEFKSKRGKLSEIQKAVIPGFVSNGYMVSVCYSLEEAIDCMKNYLGDKLNVRPNSISRIDYSTCAQNDGLIFD